MSDGSDTQRQRRPDQDGRFTIDEVLMVLTGSNTPKKTEYVVFRLVFRRKGEQSQIELRSALHIFPTNSQKDTK